MATVNVVNQSNEEAGTLELDPGTFEVRVKPHLLQMEVRRQLALRRAGTHSSKNRSTVAGGGAKPYRQKGTGRARQGTNRAPQWAGGGTVFGPVPRGHDHKLPKKVRRAALRSALSTRMQEDAITVLDALDLPDFKTRALVEMLGKLGLAESSVLIVIEHEDEKVEASARNIPNVSVIRAGGLNVYDVLLHAKLVLTRGAAEAVVRRLNSDRGEEVPSEGA